MKNPTPFETAAQGTIFPATSSSKLHVPTAFNPNEECVFSSQKKRKKVARIKPSRLSLTLITGKESSIPRGKHRKSLETRGRIKKVEFTREVSAQAVKNKIVATFREQEDFQSLAYRHLCQSQDGKLSTADNQFPSGKDFVENALKHRGNVYLVPVDEVRLYLFAS